MATSPRALQPTDPFAIGDDRAFLAALNTAIWKIVGEPELFQGLHKLNGHERSFICLDIFLAEVEADGLSHFFYYECGVLYPEVLLALEKIDAHGLKIKLEQYVEQVFQGTVPTDVNTRQSIIETAQNESRSPGEDVGDLTSHSTRFAAWARTNQHHFRRDQ